MKKTPYPLLIIVLFSGFLYLTGIRWGLPSEGAKKFYVGDINISREYLKRGWEISRENLPEKLPRSRFNAIRSFHPDEQNILKSIISMSPERFDFNPHFFEYPSCQIYLVAAVLKVISETGLIVIKPDASYYFQNPEEMAKIYLTGRMTTVLMAILGLIFFYDAALILCGKYGAIFSTACLGFCPLYAINSHYMTVDVPMVFWITVFLFLTALSVKRGRFSYIVASAFVSGIAAGTKYPAGILIFLLPFVYYGTCKKSPVRSIFDIGALFFLFLAGFLITTPYSVIAFDEFKRDILYQASARGVGFSAIFNHVSSMIDFFRALWVGSWLLLFLFVPSVYFLAKRRIFEDRIILTALVLAIVPLLVAGGFKYARYYLIALPFLCLSTGSLLDEFFQIQKKKIKLFAISLCILILMFVSVKSVAYSKLMCGKDIRITTAEYVDKQFPQGTKIVFTKDPWIFEVPPVNPEKFSVHIIEESGLEKAPSTCYLIIGELQYFLTSGNRNIQMQREIVYIQEKGFVLKKIFANHAGFGLLRFDDNWTIHDMLYTHPGILLFYKP